MLLSAPAPALLLAVVFMLAVSSATLAVAASPLSSAVPRAYVQPVSPAIFHYSLVPAAPVTALLALPLLLHPLPVA